MKTLKVKVWCYIYSCGDGSAGVEFFKTESEAEKAAENDDEPFCDNVFSKELEFDLNGNLIK